MAMQRFYLLASLLLYYTAPETSHVADKELRIAHGAKDVRNAAAIPDAEARRRVVSLLGRSGATAYLGLCKDEDADTLNDSFRCGLSDNIKEQVLYIACDNPSRKLFIALQGVFEKLIAIYLDTVHLVIAFNNAHYKKTSDGEKVLRIIMNKFNKINNDAGSTFWGALLYRH